MQRLWSPWRMSYVVDSPQNSERSRGGSSIFVEALQLSGDPDSLVLHRGDHSFIIMNLYPYNTGHMMVVPNRQVASLEDLDAEESNEVMAFLTFATRAARTVLRCDGFNIGLNIGTIAGAGISDHLHFHIVPRWLGDANFMPVTAATMVMPELLPATTARLKGEFATLEVARRNPKIRRTAGALVYLPDTNQVVLRKSPDGSIVLPKGHIESGESASDAAIREVREETGFVLSVTGWGGVDSFEHASRTFHVVTFFGTGIPGPDVSEHLETDIVLASPEAAREMIEIENLKPVLDRGIELIGRLQAGSE